MALRDLPVVALSTRRRVARIAKKLGYQSSATVSDVMGSFRRGEQRFEGLLALVNVHHSREFLEWFATFRHWTRHVRKRSLELSFGLEIFWLNEPGVSPERLTKILQARGTAGVIFAGVEANGILADSAAPLWHAFPSVVLGVRPERPQLHCVLNDHFSSARLATCRLLEHGYRKIGIVLWKEVEVLLNHRFLLGHRSALLDCASATVIPALELIEPHPAEFWQWVRKNRPDAILAHDPVVCEWLAGEHAAARYRKPFVALLDLDENKPDQPGIWQRNDEVGQRAVEMVAAQIHRSEIGPPEVATCLMIEGTWRGRLPKVRPCAGS